MWLLTKRTNKECEGLRDALENGSVPEAGRGAAAGTLLGGLPESARKHLVRCSDCRTFADELLEVRGMFEGEEGGARPGPYFLARVMTAIAEREAELERGTQTWAAVPRLAYRLSVLASLILLVAGGWVYQMPQNSTATQITAQQWSEGLVELGPAQDDLLVSTAGR